MIWNLGFWKPGCVGDGVQRGRCFTLDDLGFGFPILVSHSGHVGRSSLQLLMSITIPDNGVCHSRDDERLVKLLIHEMEFNTILISANEFLRKFEVYYDRNV